MPDPNIIRDFSSIGYEIKFARKLGWDLGMESLEAGTRKYLES